MSFETLFPLVLSNTDMSLWSQCQLRWFRARCQHLRKPGAIAIDLSAGGAFAKGMEVTRKAFYQDKLPASEAVSLGYDAVLHDMYDSGAVDDSLKSPERMALALVEYFKEFPLENEEVVPAILEDGTSAIEHKLTIELPISHPELGVPIIFKGKLDMLAIAMGRTYIVDEKTTKAIKSNEADLLATSGQFIGYAWLARKFGITVVGVKVRKVAIQKTQIQIKEFEIPITDFMIDAWETAFLQKVSEMVKFYKDVINGTDFRIAFTPDYGLGCTAYYRPCEFISGCTSKYGESFLATEFSQVVWDYEAREEKSLTEFKELLGV